MGESRSHCLLPDVGSCKLMDFGESPAPVLNFRLRVESQTTDFQVVTWIKQLNQMVDGERLGDKPAGAG